MPPGIASVLRLLCVCDGGASSSAFPQCLASYLQTAATSSHSVIGTYGVAPLHLTRHLCCFPCFIHCFGVPSTNSDSCPGFQKGNPPCSFLSVFIAQHHFSACRKPNLDQGIFLYFLGCLTFFVSTEGLNT